MTDYTSSENRKKIAKALNDYLADATVVYFKTHTFHWNVGGPHFYNLHLIFEKFYEAILQSMDVVAERTRALGLKTPPNFAELLKLASIKESGSSPNSHEMLSILHKDYMDLAKRAHEVAILADAAKDLVTMDMMTEKAAFLEKAAWMLQSSMME